MELGSQWMAFLEAEFNLFNLSVVDVLIYLFIAIICSYSVRVFGPPMLRGRYRGQLDWNDAANDGALNIVYRIISPVLWSFFLLLVLSILFSFLNIKWTPDSRWIPVLLYWIIVIAVKIPLVDSTYPFWTLLVQMLTSLLTAIYFDWAVVCRLPEYGLIAFDQSNIGWQVLFAIFFAVANIVLVGVTRGRSKYHNRIKKLNFYSALHPSSYSPDIDYDVEKKLYSYKRLYRNCFPARVLEDKLLMSFIFLVMLVEDSNRPFWARRIERLLFRTGRVKTTGIMQVKSDKILTDKESVQEAIPIIEVIWDEFLKRTARSNSNRKQPIISFSKGWYKYYSDDLYKHASRHIAELYGEYCGTSTLDVRNTFAFATAFVFRTERQIENEIIYVRSNLFDIYTEWAEGYELFFLDQGLTLHPDSLPSFSFVFELINNYKPNKAVVEEAIVTIRKADLIITEVRFIEGVQCAITAQGDNMMRNECDKLIRDELSKKLPDWIITLRKCG